MMKNNEINLDRNNISVTTQSLSLVECHKEMMMMMMKEEDEDMKNVLHTKIDAHLILIVSMNGYNILCQ